MTSLKDLKQGDVFLFPDSDKRNTVLSVDENSITIVYQEGIWTRKATIDVTTGKGHVHIPDYLLWHVAIVNDVLERRPYAEEEKKEKCYKEFPLIVDLIGGTER